MADSETAYKADHEYAQLLLSGEPSAWDRFYKEFRRKLAAYINRKYPDVFSEIAMEEIFDGLGKRLIENDYKALRNYRGECSFSAYITNATEWEIKDWLRKHSEELLHDPIDTISNDDKALKVSEPSHTPSFSDIEDLPDPIKALNYDLRFAFLLRYYDYFGFPLNEVRLLAKKKGISIVSITEKIVKHLDPGNEDILRTQREKQMAFQQRLEKICYEIHKLNLKDHKITDALDYDSQIAKLQEIRNRRSELEIKKDNLLKKKHRFVITTPYEVIAEILSEDNVSTIRSRVFLAKKQLAQGITARVVTNE